MVDSAASEDEGAGVCDVASDGEYEAIGNMVL